jgi:hypothetical protein
MRLGVTLVCAIAMVTVACSRDGDGADPGPGPSSPAQGASHRADGKQPAELGAGHVVITNAAGEQLRVAVEVARTEDQRDRGLMFRERMDYDHGMVFLFDREKIQRFWMKNTLIPLDMIFIRADMTVAGVVEHAEPLTTTSRFVDAPSQYVLEMNGGWARDNGVAAGAVVRFEGFE